MRQIDHRQISACLAVGDRIRLEGGIDNRARLLRSRSSISSIEPLISANSAVTVLRSSWAVAEAICPAEIAMLGVLREDAVD
jgi:hypothetical protein